MPTLTLPLDEQTDAMLKRLARAGDRSKAATVRALIKRAIEQLESNGAWTEATLIADLFAETIEAPAKRDDVEIASRHACVGAGRMKDARRV